MSNNRSGYANKKKTIKINQLKLELVDINHKIGFIQPILWF